MKTVAESRGCVISHSMFVVLTKTFIYWTLTQKETLQTNGAFCKS